MYVNDPKIRDERSEVLMIEVRIQKVRTPKPGVWGSRVLRSEVRNFKVRGEESEFQGQR